MRIFSSVVFYLALFILFIWVVVPLVIEVSDLEFSDMQLLKLYKSSRMYVVPVAIILTLFKSLKKRDNAFMEFRKIFISIGAALLSLVIFIGLLLDFSCDSINKQLLFINEYNPSSRIFLREYGCGSWSSVESRMEVVRIDTVLYKFTRTAKIDTTTLDKKIWHRQTN
jgi:hypothetical protein